MRFARSCAGIEVTVATPGSTGCGAHQVPTHGGSFRRGRGRSQASAARKTRTESGSVPARQPGRVKLRGRVGIARQRRSGHARDDVVIQRAAHQVPIANFRLMKSNRRRS